MSVDIFFFNIFLQKSVLLIELGNATLVTYKAKKCEYGYCINKF